jgi:predicted component of type VI protein secretion system
MSTSKEDHNIATLTVESGESPGKIIHLNAQSMTIGRGQDVDISFTHPFISRQHATIRLKNGKYILKDTNSSNGTLLNDSALEAMKDYTLKDNDVIELAKGFLVMRFRQSERTIPVTGNQTPQNTSGINIDSKARDVFVDGQKLDPDLALKEFDLLSHLYKNINTACSKDDIASQVWQNEFVTDEQIEQCIYRLRKRVEVNSSDPKRIVTLRGFGYKLVSE